MPLETEEVKTEEAEPEEDIEEVAPVQPENDTNFKRRWIFSIYTGWRSEDIHTIH